MERVNEFQDAQMVITLTGFTDSQSLCYPFSPPFGEVLVLFHFFLFETGLDYPRIRFVFFDLLLIVWIHLVLRYGQ